MRRIAWLVALLIGCLVAAAVVLVFLSSYELDRLRLEETRYPTPEDAFLAQYPQVEKIEIEGSGEDLFGLWYVAGCVWERDKETGNSTKKKVGALIAPLDDGWVFVPENSRTFLMAIGMKVQSLWGVSRRFQRVERLWDRITKRGHDGS